MLTLEFSVLLSPNQVTQIHNWLNSLKSQWNLGLNALEEFDRRTYYHKTDKCAYACCPIAEGDWLLEERRVALTCPISAEPPPLLLRSQGIKSPGGLSIMARSDVVATLASEERRRGLLDVPAKFRLGCLSLLSVAWMEYLKDRGSKSVRKRGKPKYKRFKDKITCLYSGNLKNELICQGDTISGVPKLGTIEVPHLSRRWLICSGEDQGKPPAIAAFKIIFRNGKFYVQLTGDLKKDYKPKSSDKATGIDLGLIYAHVDSDGNRSPALSLAEERQVAQKQRLQAQLDAKLDQRLLLWLRNLATTIEMCREIIRVSEKTWENLRTCKTISDVARAIGQKGDRRFQILRHRLPKSKREEILVAQIKRLDYCGGATRKVRDEKLTTRIAKRTGFIAIENGIQREQLRHRPAPIKTETGFAPNGASLQSESNRQLSSLSPGRKIDLLKRKAERYRRIFKKIESPYTTAECPVCGRLNTPSNRIDEHGDRLYSCQCKWTCDQDIHAAVNIELKAFGLDLEAELSETAKYARTLSDRYAANHPERLRPSWVTGVVNLDEENDLRRIEDRESSDFGGTDKVKQPKIKGGSRKNRAKVLQSKG